MVHLIIRTGERLELVVTNTHTRIQAVMNQCLPKFHGTYQAQQRDLPVQPSAGYWSESSLLKVWSMGQQHWHNWELVRNAKFGPIRPSNSESSSKVPRRLLSPSRLEKLGPESPWNTCF